MTTYTVHYNEDSSPKTVFVVNDDDTTLSFAHDESNPHFSAYAAWLAEGNTPNPYVPPPAPPPLTAAEKLEAAGLTVDELKELLGL